MKKKKYQKQNLKKQVNNSEHNDENSKKIDSLETTSIEVKRTFQECPQCKEKFKIKNMSLHSTMKPMRISHTTAENVNLQPQENGISEHISKKLMGAIQF